MTRKGGITSTLKEPGAKQEFFNSDEVAKVRSLTTIFFSFKLKLWNKLQKIKERDSGASP